MKTFCIFCSLIAVVFSVLALCGHHCMRLDGALTIVSICVTLIVGVSVVDAIAVHNILSKYNGKMDAMTERLNKLSSLEEQLHKAKRQTNLLLHFTWGLSFSKEQPYTAIAEYWKAIELAASDNDVKRAKSCIHNLEEVVRRVSEESKQIADNSNEEALNAIPKEFPKELRKSCVYIAFEKRFDELIGQINQLRST